MHLLKRVSMAYVGEHHFGFCLVFHESRYFWFMGSQCTGILQDLTLRELHENASSEFGRREVLQPTIMRICDGHKHPHSLTPREPNWLVSVTAGDGGLEMDMLGDLESLQFEYGIQEEDRSLLYLQGRSRGLVIKTFAHATFCKLLCYLR